MALELTQVVAAWYREWRFTFFYRFWIFTIIIIFAMKDIKETDTDKILKNHISIPVFSIYNWISNTNWWLFLSTFYLIILYEYMYLTISLQFSVSEFGRDLKACK